MLQLYKKAILAAQEIVLAGDPYLNFINSLKSDATRKGYRNSLIRFMRHFEIKDTVTLSKLPTKDIAIYLIKYFKFLKQQNRSVRSMDCILNAVEHFCVMNDIVANPRKINKFSIFIYKFLDKPRTCYPVHFCMLPCYPFHA